MSTLSCLDTLYGYILKELFYIWILLNLCGLLILQSEAELLAEKKCVAHLTGEVIIMLLLTYTHAHTHQNCKIPHINPFWSILLLTKFLLYLCRVLQSAIYPGTRCFLEKCRINCTKVIYKIFAWYLPDTLNVLTSGSKISSPQFMP